MNFEILEIIQQEKRIISAHTLQIITSILMGQMKRSMLSLLFTRRDWVCSGRYAMALPPIQKGFCCTGSVHGVLRSYVRKNKERKVNAA